MSRARHLSALVIVALALAILPFRAIPGAAGAEEGASAACRVRGVWELESETINGKENPLTGYTQRKVLTDRYFMWMGTMNRRDTLSLKTLVDTLQAYHVNGGGGTYSTSGNTYIEHIDLENDPSWVGTSFKATCRVEGNVWYHGFTIPNDTTKGPYHRWVEVWRRVE